MKARTGVLKKTSLTMGPNLKKIKEDLKSAVQFTLTSYNIEDSCINLQLKLSDEIFKSSLVSNLDKSFKANRPINGRIERKKLQSWCHDCKKLIPKGNKETFSFLIDFDDGISKCTGCELIEETNIIKASIEDESLTTKEHDVREKERDFDTLKVKVGSSKSSSTVTSGTLKGKINFVAKVSKTEVSNVKRDDVVDTKDKDVSTPMVSDDDFDDFQDDDNDKDWVEDDAQLSDHNDSHEHAVDEIANGKLPTETEQHSLSNGKKTMEFFHCEYCPNYKFVYKSKLQEHFKTKKHVERVQGKHGKGKKESQSGHTFRCPLCPKEFTTHDLLNTHLETTIHIRPQKARQTRDKVRKYVCPVCNKDHVTQAYLRKHLEDHSVEEQKQALKSRATVGGSCTDEDSVTAQDASMEIEQTLDQQPSDINLSKVEFEVVKSEPVEIDPEEQKLILELVEQPRKKRVSIYAEDFQEHKCTFCDHVFSTKTQFLHHCRYSHAVSIAKESFLCHLCGEAFSSKANVDKHTASNCEFSEKKRQRCKICKLWTRNSVTLEKHMKIHNEDEKKYMCELCGKCFLKKNLLNSHKLTHQNYRPHQCDLCDQKFRNIWHMKAHRRIHTGENLFQCPKCHDWFVNESYVMNKHLTSFCRAIKVASCEVCGQEFHRKPELARHMGYHTGERPYLCSKCGVAFTSPAALDDHFKRHFEEKNLNCPICNKAFSRNNELQKHIKRHDGVKKHGYMRRYLNQNLKPQVVPNNAIVTDHELDQATVIVSEAAESVLNLSNVITHLKEAQEEVTVSTSAEPDLLSGNQLTYQASLSQSGEEIHVVIPSELSGTAPEVRITEAGEIILVAMDPKSSQAK